MTSDENKQVINNIKKRLQGNLITEKIDALLDATEFGEEGIKLIASMLNDTEREVRESAYTLLDEIDNEITRQVIYNHLPFLRMQCLHVIDDFEFDEHNFNNTVPDYFAIADYNNSLVCWWDYAYKQSLVNLRKLSTGQKIKNINIVNHEFGLGKQGKIAISSFQHIFLALDMETNKYIEVRVV